MIRLLIYIPPILVNYILGGVFFITAHRFAQAGEGAILTTATMAVWGVIYALSSYIVSRLTSENNAPKLIVFSGIGISLTSVGFIVVPHLYCQFVWIAAVGIFSALCTAPFQVFMKSIETDKSAGTVIATSLYTFSWSCGMGTGPFVFGNFSSTTGFIINGVMGMIIAGIIGGIARFYHPEKSPDTAVVTPSFNCYENLPDLAKLGWIVGGVGTFAVAIVRTLVPYRAELAGISKADAGITLAIVSLVQGLTALALIRGKYWMYNKAPALVINIAGILGLIGFGFATDRESFMVSALIYGIYSGCAYFYLVFHSLVHPTKSSRYVGVNEMVVGISSISSPVVSGLLASMFASATVPFILGTFLVGLTAVIQIKLSKRY